MLIKEGERLVFFGDSLTQRTDLKYSEVPARRYRLDYAESYVDILMKRLLVHYPHLNLSFFNCGVGGDTVFHLLERYSEDVLPLCPTRVVLWIGQNDAKQFDEQRFEQGFRCLLQWFSGDKIPVVVLSTSAHRDLEKMSVLARVDRILQSVCREFAVHFIDIKTPMLQIAEHNKTAKDSIQLFTEGSHLSELGNILVADTVFDFFESH